MENDEGVRSRTQLQGQAPDGSLKNYRTDANGNLMVSVAGGGQTGSKDKVIASGVVTAGTTATSVSINANVTTIEVANYAEEADVTITIGQESVVIGANIATDIPINAEVTSMSIAATAADTKVYYLVKGVVEE